MIPGRGFDFEFRRTYRGNDSMWFEYGFPQLTTASQSTLDVGEPVPPEDSCIAPMGAQWWHSYAMLIYTFNTASTGGTASYPNLIKDGRLDSFSDRLQDTSDIAWTNEDTDAVVRYVPAAGQDPALFVYQSAAGGKYEFEQFGFPENNELGAHDWFRLRTISDRNGNELNIAYKGADSVRIDHIIDTLGNQITFEYNAPGNGYLISAIVDETGGRRITYEYAATRLCLSCQDDGYTEPGGGGGSLAGTGDTSANIPASVAEPEPWQGGGGVAYRSYVLKKVYLPPLGYDATSSVYDDLPSDLEHNFRYAGSRMWEYAYDYIALLADSDDDPDDAEECDAIRLASIVDPSGTTLLANTYGAHDPSDGALRGRPFVLKQQTPSGTYDYFYNFSNPDNDVQTDDYTVTISTKRGQVVELGYVAQPSLREDTCCSLYCWDDNNFGGGSGAAGGHGRLANFLVSREHFTGFDDKSTTTVVEHNGKVRASDPASFGTAYTRNDSWKLTNVTDPLGYTTELGYGYRELTTAGGLATDDVDRAYKKLALTQRTRSGGGETIVEKWRYGFDLGGCCGASFPTGYQDGNGNVTLYRYDTAGNITGVFRGISPTSFSVDTVVDVGNVSSVKAASLFYEEFQYGALSHNLGQLEYHTHAGRLNVGETVETHQVDYYEYEDDTNELGYGRLISITRDAGGENLTTSYAYNAVGDVVRVTQNSGDYKTLHWNQAGQIIREQWYGYVDGTNDTLLTWREYFYDNRGNPVRTDTIAFDSASGSRPSARTADNWAITLSEYDAENNLLCTARRESVALNSEGTTLPAPDLNGAYSLDATVSGSGWTPSDWVITEYQYDENKNLVAVRLPQSITQSADDPGTPGIDESQPDNGYVIHYDERDLVYRRFSGISDPALAVIPAVTTDPVNDPLPTVSQVDYDENGRQKRSVMLDPLTGDESREHTMTYDAFGRLLARTDPMGNSTSYAYDANGNVLSNVFTGELLDVAGTAGNTLLAASKTDYDALNRPTDQYVGVFDPGAQGAPGSIGAVTEWQWSHTVYNSDSSVRSITVPAGTTPKPSYASGAGTTGTTSYLYDSAGRLALVTDAAGNETEYSLYDADSNLILLTSREVSGVDQSVQTYATSYEYDGLDRLTILIEGIYDSGSAPENTTVYSYDSRSNLIQMLDPRGTATTHSYDGLNRRYLTTVDPTSLAIVTAVGYDKSSRVISLTDDNSHSTSYTYDSLGREIARKYADGSVHTTAYDPYGNVSATQDARNTLVENTYDLNDRLIERDIIRAVGSNVGGTVDESYKYDALGRVVRANNDFARIWRDYDSRGLLIREMFNADSDASFPTTSQRVVSSEYNLAGTMTLCTYPSGREVYREYDVLNRVGTILDDDQATEIAAYDYYGPGRVERRTTGDGAGQVETLYTYTGYEGESPAPSAHGFRHIASVEHRLVASPNTLLEGRSFTWDPAGSKTSHDDLRSSYTGRRNRSFTYDAANRLTGSASAFPDASGQNGTIGYVLDGVHNRTEVTLTGTDNSGAAVGDYVSLGAQDGDGKILHQELNQYTVVPRLDGGTLDFQYVYDANGNLQVVAEYPRPADFSGNYVVDLTDLNQWVAAFTSSDMAADFNGDGVLDLADQTGFVNAHSTSQGTFYNASFKYDERNQLVGFTAFEGTTRLKGSTYRYDCFNRRVASLLDTDGDGVTDTETWFVYAGQAAWQLVEEYPSAVPTWSTSQGEEDHDSTVRKSYTYGNYIDEVLTMRAHASGEDFFYHQDDLFSVYAITDEDGAVVERYEYGDYGQVTVLDASGALRDPDSDGRSESVYGNRHTFTGRLLDEELTLAGGEQVLQYRHRYMTTGSGRFLHRDSYEYDNGMNLYAYAVDAPLHLRDPFGLEPWQFRPPNMPIYPGDSPTAPQPDEDITGCLIRCMDQYLGIHGVAACLSALGLDYGWSPVPKTPHEMRMPHRITDDGSRARRLAIRCHAPRWVRRPVKLIGRLGGGLIGRLIAYPSCAYTLGLFAGCADTCARDPDSY